MPAPIEALRSRRRWAAVRLAIAALAALALPTAGVAAAGDDPVDFTREIRPVFAAKCFACHGPDESHREADLRLDVRGDAVDYGAIVPGEADASELIRRILSDDPDEVMPPPHTGDTLTAEERERFVRWVDQGAEYRPHWAFVPPERPPVPVVEGDGWSRNPIDRFVLQRLRAEGLQPSGEADRHTLIRRVSLDLIGLPPTPREADAFAADPDPMAYERLVDRLLASPHYGPRWAQPWLDLARYADTNGYEKDRDRSVWPYRDWVIDALNDDQPYDRFTIEQLAGDMLPDATTSQQIATGFHRNTMLNEEGGIDPLEYRFYAMVDRVATTGTVWLGLSTGCAQCHTHKYDPITHTDYYALMGLLNNADEPDLVLPSDAVDAERERITQRIARLEGRLADAYVPPDADATTTSAQARAHLETRFAQWVDEAKRQAIDWRTIVPSSWETNLPRLERLDDGSLLSTGDITKRDTFTLRLPLDAAGDGPIAAIRLEVLPDERLPGGGPGRSFYEGRRGDFFLSEMTLAIDRQPLDVADASVSFGRISVGSGTADAANVFDGDGSTGWSTATREGKRHQLVATLAEPIAAAGELTVTMLFERHFAASLGRFRLSVASDGDAQAFDRSPEVEAALLSDETPQPTADDPLWRHFLNTLPELADARKPIDRLRRSLPEPPTTLVMRERPADNPRLTHRHHRGEYLSPKEPVDPGVPAFLRSDDDATPRDRLELARWLVSDDNPLAARVAANRAWQSLFGLGLQRAADDFGVQTEPPSHPELLDWLACEFADAGWSSKRLHRLIVTSATYRQSSEALAEAYRRDPENRMLARGPRVRLSGETIRDTLLHASGLLSGKLRGPGVYPPQPAAVTAVAYGQPEWTVSEGEDRHRRSVYTFRKRTAPFAAFAAFDAPSGERCIARRDRSNTPLQSLTLLNDAMSLDIARALAATCNEADDSAATATRLFRRLLIRPPSDGERDAIVAFYFDQLERLRSGELDAAEIAATESASAERAAWTLAARAVMNLDETVTKP